MPWMLGDGSLWALVWWSLGRLGAECFLKDNPACLYTPVASHESIPFCPYPMALPTANSLLTHVLHTIQCNFAVLATLLFTPIVTFHFYFPITFTLQPHYNRTRQLQFLSPSHGTSFSFSTSSHEHIALAIASHCPFQAATYYSPLLTILTPLHVVPSKLQPLLLFYHTPRRLTASLGTQPRHWGRGPKPHCVTLSHTCPRCLP